jgi:hypothetical protein
MSEPPAGKLETIRKLLALAERAGTEAEAEVANRKAEAMIAEYGIEAAMLADAGAIADEVGNRIMVLPDPYARQKAQLLTDISGPLRVQVIWNLAASRRIKGFQVHLFGMQSDLDRLDVLFTSLLVQAATGMAQARPDAVAGWRQQDLSWTWVNELKPTATQVAAFRRDWLAGFGRKVSLRLKESENRAKADAPAASGGAPGAELVLVHRDDLVKRAIRGFYPRLGSSRARAVRNADAYNHGYAAGARADLGGARIAGRTRRSIGN